MIDGRSGAWRETRGGVWRRMRPSGDRDIQEKWYVLLLAFAALIFN